MVNIFRRSVFTSFMFLNIIARNLVHILATISIVAFANVAMSQQVSSESNRKTAPNSQPLTIALGNISYPHHFVNEQGNPAGIMVDFWRLWSKRTGINVVFKPMLWRESLDQVSSGDIDIHGGLTALDERKIRFDFSDRIYPQYSYLYLNKSLPQIDNISALSPYTVGVVTNGSHEVTVTKVNSKIRTKAFTNRRSIYQAALAGEIYAFAELEQLDKTYDNYSQLVDLFPRYKRLNYYVGDYVAAIAKGRDELRAKINNGINLITVAEREAIEQKWLKQDKPTDVINIVYTDNLPPYMGHSLSGQPQGLYIDIWKLWSQYTGIEVSFTADTMSGGLAQIKTGLASLHLAYPVKESGIPGVRKARKIYGLQSKVFVRSSFGDIFSVSELAGEYIGLYETSPYIDQLRTEYPSVKLKYFTSHQDMITAAEREEIAAIVIEVENMKVQLVNANMQSLFYILPEPAFETSMFTLVGENNEQLAQFIREGFSLIPIRELQKVERDWLGADESNYFQQFSEKVAITQEEQKWILDNPVLKVGIVKDWAPMEFVGPNGNIQGINRDIIELIAKSLGLQVAFSAFDDWPTLMNAFKEQKVDVILGVSKTPERDKLFDFSNVYSEMPWSIIHHQNFGTQNSIDAFYGKSLAFIKGYDIADSVRKSHPEINIVEVETAEQGLIAVQQGLVNGFIEALPVGANLLKKESVVPLTISVVDEMPIESNRIVLNKGNQQLAKLLNKSLTILDDDRRKKIFDRWFNVNIQTGLDKRFVTKVAAQVGGLLLVIFIIIAFWNRRLRREIELRKTLENRMKHMATHDELTGLANRALLNSQLDTSIAQHQRQQAKFAILFVDLDGFKAINDAYGHDVGDTALKDVAKRIKECTRRSDTVARFGGDEFVILLTNINNKEEAAFIAEKVIHAFDMPFAFERGDKKLGCSIGIAVYPDDGNQGNELLKMSDTLMYRVKSTGKNNYLYR